MNKIFDRRWLLVIGLFSILFFTEGYAQKKIFLSPRLSFDVSGNHKASSQGQNISLNTSTGISVGLEVMRNTDGLFNIGFGLSYLLERELENTNGEKFNFLPLYGLVTVDLIQPTEDGENIIPKIVGAIGYNIVYGGNDKYKGPLNLSGGLYLGGGLRIQVDRIYFEGMYRSFSGSADISLGGQTFSADITYSTFSVTLGLSL